MEWAVQEITDTSLFSQTTTGHLATPDWTNIPAVRLIIVFPYDFQIRKNIVGDLTFLLSYPPILGQTQPRTSLLSLLTSLDQ